MSGQNGAQRAGECVIVLAEHADGRTSPQEEFSQSLDRCNSGQSRSRSRRGAEAQLSIGPFEGAR